MLKNLVVNRAAKFTKFALFKLNLQQNLLNLQNLLEVAD